MALRAKPMKLVAPFVATVATAAGACSAEDIPGNPPSVVTAKTDCPASAPSEASGCRLSGASCLYGGTTYTCIYSSWCSGTVTSTCPVYGPKPGDPCATEQSCHVACPGSVAVATLACARCVWTVEAPCPLADAAADSHPDDAAADASPDTGADS